MIRCRLVVAAVCSARNADLARSLGAETVVDYRREDFAKHGRCFDIVVDLVGNRSLRDLRRVLRRDGRLVLSGGGGSGEGRVLGPLGLLVRAQLLSRILRVRLSTPRATPDASTLAELSGLVDAGVMAPILDRTFRSMMPPRPSTMSKPRTPEARSSSASMSPTRRSARPTGRSPSLI